jgi:hypothetical protein
MPHRAGLRLARPVDEIEAFRKRISSRMPWFSTMDNFNADFDVPVISASMSSIATAAISTAQISPQDAGLRRLRPSRRAGKDSNARPPLFVASCIKQTVDSHFKRHTSGSNIARDDRLKKSTLRSWVQAPLFLRKPVVSTITPPFGNSFDSR